MTDYVIWTRGLRGPRLAVLRNSSLLTSDERRELIAGPIPIAANHDGLSISELSALYPLPRSQGLGGALAPVAPKPSPIDNQSAGAIA